MPIDPISIALGVASTALGIVGASKQSKAEEDAAKKAEEVGKLQARQYVTEMFLAQTQGFRQSQQRLRSHKQSEAQNFAYFAAMGRFDQSVEAYLNRQKEIANEDVETIERQSKVTQSNLETTASVAWKYGQNEAAGIRAQSRVNLISNIGKIAQNFPITAFRSNPPPTTPFPRSQAK